MTATNFDCQKNSQPIANGGGSIYDNAVDTVDIDAIQELADRLAAELVNDYWWT